MLVDLTVEEIEDLINGLWWYQSETDYNALKFIEKLESYKSKTNGGVVKEPLLPTTENESKEIIIPLQDINCKCYLLKKH